MLSFVALGAIAVSLKYAILVASAQPFNEDDITYFRPLYQQKAKAVSKMSILRIINSSLQK